MKALVHFLNTPEHCTYKKSWDEVQVNEKLGVCALFWQYVFRVLATCIICLLGSVVAPVYTIIRGLGGLLFGYKLVRDSNSVFERMSRNERIFFSLFLWPDYFEQIKMGTNASRVMYTISTGIALVLFYVVINWISISESQVSSVIGVLMAIAGSVVCLAGIVFGVVWVLCSTELGVMIGEVWHGFWTKACPIPAYEGGTPPPEPKK
jgi:hypothetical protein